MRTVMMLVLAASLLVVVGCGKRYLVITNDCQHYVTKGSPTLDSKSGMYKVKDAAGQELMIKKEDVKIMERID